MGFFENVDLTWLVLPNRCCHPWLFFAWRLAFAIYTAVLYYLYERSFEDPQDRFPFSLIYLTTWGALLVAISAVGLFTLHFLTGFGNFVRPFFKNFEGCGLVVTRLLYFVYEIGLVQQVLIPLLYWLANYPFLSEEEKPKGFNLFISINSHGIFTLLITIDYLLSKIRVIRSHIWALMTFVICYLLLNYWYSTNYGLIYPIITWDSAFSFIFVGIAVIFMIISFYLCAFIGGVLVLIMLRSQVIIQAVSGAMEVTPVAGWEQEALIILYIFGSALTFFFLVHKIGEMKEETTQLSENNELLVQQNCVEMPTIQARPLNEPVTRLEGYNLRDI